MNDATTLRPLGVPLDEIESRFRAADLEVSRDGDTLVLHHDTPLGGERLQTRVAVMAPDAADAQANAVTAVIRIFTALPSAYARRYDAEMISFANRFASLGAFTVSEGFSFVGSRLTIYEGSPDWDWQLPLAVTAAAASVDAVTGGMERFLKKAQPQAGSSSWTEPDLDAVEAELAKTCACTRNRSGLAAEFSLKSAAPAGKPGAGAAYWELLDAAAPQRARRWPALHPPAVAPPRRCPEASRGVEPAQRQRDEFARPAAPSRRLVRRQGRGQFRLRVVSA